MITLSQIKTHLRAGLHPRDFGGKSMAGGSQRHVFLVDEFVVKQRVPAWQHDHGSNVEATDCSQSKLYTIPRQEFRRVGIYPPAQWRMGDWVIQPFYRPLTAKEWDAWKWINTADIYWKPTKTHRRVRLDMHCENLGVNLQTYNVHAIDW